MTLVTSVGEGLVTPTPHPCHTHSPKLPGDPVVDGISGPRSPSLIEDVLGLDGAQLLLVAFVGHAVQELLQLAAHQRAPSAGGRGHGVAGAPLVGGPQLSQERV